MRLSYGFWTYAILLGLLVPAALFRAYVLLQCWKWFLAPLGAPAVTHAHVYGIACVVALLTFQPVNVKDEEIAGAGETPERGATGMEKFLLVGIHIAQTAGVTSVFWILAAIAHAFM